MIQEWKKEILAEMKGYLRLHGFKKRGQVFERTAGEVTQVIPFYMYQSGIDEYNIGIEVTASSRTIYSWLSAPEILRYDWVSAELRLNLDLVSTKLEYATVKTSGRQWLITDRASVDRAKQSIVEHLDSFGIMFLDCLFTTECIVQKLAIRKIGFPYMTWFSPGMPTVRSDYVVDCYLGIVDPEKVPVMDYTQAVFRREPHRQGKVTVIDLKDRFPEQS